MSFRIHNGKLLITGNTLSTGDDCCCWYFCCQKYESSESGPVLVGRACSLEPCPEGWEQVSYHATPGLCAEDCCCPIPSWWQIEDDDGNIYAAGPIINCTAVDFPIPFTPLYYWRPAGFSPPINNIQINFNLKVTDCGEPVGMATVATQALQIVLCQQTNQTPFMPANARYPTWDVTVAPVPLPPECECEQPEAGPAPMTNCVACSGQLNFAAGTGQNWRWPPREPAVKFVGTIDGEWTNLNNWQDPQGLSPASALPTVTSNVIVEADVTSKPADYTVQVNSLTIQPGASFDIEAECEVLSCKGTIGRPASPVCVGTYGKVTYWTSATFTDGILAGELIQGPVGSDAVFNGTGGVSGAGILTGGGVFNDLTSNDGVVSGGLATFNDYAKNANTGTAWYATFNDNSQNKGNVIFTATFNDSSCNSGTAGTLVPPSPPSC